MLKTKIIIGVLVVGIVAVGYVTFNKKSVSQEAPGNPSIDEVSDTPETTQTSGKKMAFSQFIKQDFGSYKCDVKQSVSDFVSSGTVYMNEGKLRGEFSTVAEGRKMDSSFIMKEGYTYNWSSMIPMGVKVKIPDTSATPNTSTNTSGTYSWNAEQIGEYNCEEWKADETKFELPSGITFTEIN